MFEKEELRKKLFERAEKLSELTFEKTISGDKKQLNWCRLSLYSLQVISGLLKDSETERIQERIEVIESVIKR